MSDSANNNVVLDIADLLGERSVEAGFIWESGEVMYDPHKNRQKVSLGMAPHAKVVDVAKFEANFPGCILKSLDGTSIKVMCQAVTRRARLRDRQVTDAQMRPLVLNGLKAIKNRAQPVVIREKVKVFVVDGVEFTDVEEAIDAQREVFLEMGLADDVIEKLLAKMIA